MNKLSVGLGVLTATLLALPASAGTISGTVKDTNGDALNGVMVRLTNAANVSESVFTNAKGEYTLKTDLKGKMNVRLRLPYYRDTTDSVKLSAKGKRKKNMTMTALTDKVEISDSLPAAYHFGNLPFEKGDDKDFNRYQFQRDCLSCHQLGNPFTRVPRKAESWATTIQRMHLYVGNFDMALRDRRGEIFEEGFDGKPLIVRPQFPVDKALQTAKIYEYPLLNRGVPHDAIVHMETGLLYTVDQALHHMSITDPKTGKTEYVAQKGSRADDYYKSTPGNNDVAKFDPKQWNGPHSLDLGNDGKYYVTNTGTTSIGVFNPKTNEWETSHKLPDEWKGRYPHSIRVNKAGMVWFTMAGGEHIGRLNAETGKFDIVPLPKVKAGGISGGTQPYGIDINPLDDSMWYGRLFGDKVGRVDSKTLEVTEYDSPVRGPRRMHFDKKGILWLTGYSEGQLARIDVTDFDNKSKVYDMPEFAPGYRPAPYALNVHPDTQEIWLNENMTDRLYRFIPNEERFIAYPVPLSGTYTRDTTFTPDGKICTSNNPVPAVALEGGQLQIICIDTNAI